MPTPLKGILILILVATIAILMVRQEDANFSKTGAVSMSSETYLKSPVRILFVGDMMFDRTMRKIAEKKGYDFLFSCVADYLKGFDIVVGNLEGPITEEPSLSLVTKPGEENNTTFTFSPDVAPALFRANVRMVNLGNNHALDFGRKAREGTISHLNKSGVKSFGSPENISATTTLRGADVSFVGFNQFLGENDAEKTRAAIWKAKRVSDIVAVYAHWGDEYVKETEYQRSLAHSFIDAGADIVIGSHPHVIQSHELYGGKNIYYSLGNFIFDQYFEESVTTGLGVEVEFDGEELIVKEDIFDITRDGLTCRSGKI